MIALLLAGVWLVPILLWGATATTHDPWTGLERAGWALTLLGPLLLVLGDAWGALGVLFLLSPVALLLFCVAAVGRRRLEADRARAVSRRRARAAVGRHRWARLGRVARASFREGRMVP